MVTGNIQVIRILYIPIVDLISALTLMPTVGVVCSDPLLWSVDGSWVIALRFLGGRGRQRTDGPTSSIAIAVRRVSRVS